MSRKPRSRTHRDEAVDALSSLLSSGHGPVSRAALERICAVPLLFDAPAGARSHHGNVVVDSWSTAPGIALRDIPEGHVRRLQLRWKTGKLDLVAERTAAGWQFVARVHRAGRVAHDYALQVDSRRLLPHSGGYYTWQTRGVPRTLQLLSREQRIVFEELAWS